MPSSLPTVAQKAGMEQKKAIRATTLIKALGKPTLTSAQAPSAKEATKMQLTSLTLLYAYYFTAVKGAWLITGKTTKSVRDNAIWHT